VAAALTLSPLFLTFWLEPVIFDDLRLRATFVAIVVIAVSFLMASSLPTYSWGSVRLRAAQRLPALLAVGLFAGALFTAPWMTLTLAAIAYAAAVPLAARSYARMKARDRLTPAAG
jgi:CDP-diacylglycerol---serine O-phosphatidyltransferase